MGYGEVVGNESVHWTVVHEDERGRETASVRGRDPIRFEDIGAKRGKKGLAAKRAPAKSLFTKPNFRVRLRYATKEQAQRAKETAEIVRAGRLFLPGPFACRRCTGSARRSTRRSLRPRCASTGNRGETLGLRRPWCAR